MGIHVADAHFHADAQALTVLVWRIGEIFLLIVQEVQVQGDDDGPGHVGVVIFFDIAAGTHIGNEAQQTALADGVFTDDIVGPFVESHFDVLQIPVILNTHVSNIHKITSFSTLLLLYVFDKKRATPFF